MDLSNFKLREILLAALKSEIESKEVYLQLKDRVKNFVLKDKFDFLAKEEEKHRVFFEKLFLQNFSDKDMVLPEKSPVPLPQIEISNESTPISKILEQAMKAELAASDFYKSMLSLFEDQLIKKTLEYIATVELSHYKILEAEKEYAEKFEDYEGDWPLFHVGP